VYGNKVLQGLDQFDKSFPEPVSESIAAGQFPRPRSSVTFAGSGRYN
jgi:hypothetical protein